MIKLDISLKICSNLNHKIQSDNLQSYGYVGDKPPFNFRTGNRVSD